MPKRQAARERAQATVTAASASAQPFPAVTEEEDFSVRVSPERWDALKALAGGRSPDAVIAALIDEHLRQNGLLS